MRKNYSSYNPATVFLLFTLTAASCTSGHYPDALEAEEALGSFQLDSAFRIELFASEPLVMDPVELVFERPGRAYVVEMEDYPFKPAPGEEKGRIRLVEDTDGDGRADTSFVFADRLSEVTSVLPWKGGLLVTTAPYILFLKDTTGDGRADSREVLFSGFFENNSEAQITNLRFGVDNWIYASNHGQAGEVRFQRKPDAPAVPVGGADFRFRLDRNLFEPETGPAQFGQALNDWNHRFITQNTIHIQQTVIPWRYLHRHAYLPSDRAATDISDHGLPMFQQTPAPYWRAERTRRRQREYEERGLDRKEYAEDHFTGASGGTIYAGDAFPEEFYGNVFTGDVSGNLVHRDILSLPDDSPVYRASRAESERDREFLSSSDPWFRPVGFATGPDGFLYVIDMYRQHIETPLSIPEDLKADMDFMNGSDRGRIYRIVPKNGHGPASGTPAGSSPPDRPFDAMETETLVNLLKHPNRWWRIGAQQQLVERQDVSAVPALTDLFFRHDDPRTRLHALYTLEGLGALRLELVIRAMEDPHGGVREHGLILAERFPESLPQVIGCAGDASARVVLQACLSLGEFPAGQTIPVLADVLERHAGDPWFRLAVLSSEAGASPDMLDALARRGFFSETTPGRAAFLEDFSYVAAARAQPGEATDLLETIQAFSREEWMHAVLQGMIRGIGRRENRGAAVAEIKDRLEALKTGASPGLARLIDQLLTPAGN
ncbi:MAG: dehydrogenase [Solitalea sp.]